MNSMGKKKKFGSTNGKVTLNYVLNLGMKLGLRCIHRLPHKVYIYSHITVFFHWRYGFLSLSLFTICLYDLNFMFFFLIIFLMGPKLYIEWACARLMDPTPLKSSAILDSNPSKAQFSFMYVEFMKTLQRWDIVQWRKWHQDKWWCYFKCGFKRCSNVWINFI